MRMISSIVLRQTVRRAARTLGSRVRAVIACQPLFDPFAAVVGAQRVYWAQDDFVGGAGLMGLSPNALGRGEANLTSAADIIIASSPSVAARLERKGYDPVLIPFGCDDERFAATDMAPTPTDVVLPSPVAGLIGHLNDRTDLRLLEAVADDGHSLLVVGPHDARFEPARFHRLVSRPNVAWVGSKSSDAVLSYMRVTDVALVPYTDSSFNRGSFPLKTLESLSAGRGVVATDLPSTRWLDTDLIRIASEPQAFSRAVADALAEPRTTELVERRRAFGSRHSWARRAEEFTRVLGIEA